MVTCQEAREITEGISSLKVIGRPPKDIVAASDVSNISVVGLQPLFLLKLYLAVLLTVLIDLDAAVAEVFDLAWDDVPR